MYDFSAAACVCRDERIAFATFQRCQRPKSFYGSPMVSAFYDTKSDIGLVGYTLFKTEELFLVNYPGLLTPDLRCMYHE